VTPLVSIIIPAYNRVDFLAEAIDSVLEQSYPAVECVVIDDGSIDATPQLLQSYGGRVVALSQENQGQAAAVNRGFGHSRGELLGVLGSDDRLYPGAIAWAAEALRAAPEAVAAHGDVEVTDEHDEPICRYGVGDFQLVDCVRHHVGPASTGILYRRWLIDELGGWDDGYPFGLDFEFWLRIGTRGPYVHVPEMLGNFRRHAGSVTAARHDDEALAREWVGVIETFLDRDDLPDAVTAALRAEALRTAHYGAGVIVGGPMNQSGERYLIDDRVAPVTAHVPGAVLPER
jgi:glycosyltransferase involved in cell wall biosynthesis